MSKHNQLVWDDFLLCIGMELAYYKNGERPINEQKIAEKMMELGDRKSVCREMSLYNLIQTIRYYLDLPFNFKE